MEKCRFKLTRPFSVSPDASGKYRGHIVFFGNIVSGGVVPGMHLVLPKSKGAITTMVIEDVKQGGNSQGRVPGVLAISIAFEDRAAFEWWKALDLKAGDELQLLGASHSMN